MNSFLNTPPPKKRGIEVKVVGHRSIVKYKRIRIVKKTFYRTLTLHCELSLRESQGFSLKEMSVVPFFLSQSFSEKDSPSGSGLWTPFIITVSWFRDQKRLTSWPLPTVSLSLLAIVSEGNKSTMCSETSLTICNIGFFLCIRGGILMTVKIQTSHLFIGKKQKNN